MNHRTYVLQLFIVLGFSFLGCGSKKHKRTNPKVKVLNTKDFALKQKKKISVSIDKRKLYWGINKFNNYSFLINSSEQFDDSLKETVDENGIVLLNGKPAAVNIQYRDTVAATLVRNYIPAINSISVDISSLCRDEIVSAINEKAKGALLISVSGSKLKEKLKCIIKLKVPELYLSIEEPISDNEISYISKINNLFGLDISGSPITDKSLTQISKLTKLHILNISYSHITDRGFALLSKLTKLEVLEVDHTKIADESLKVIAKFKSLKELNLDSTKISGKKFRLLKDLKLIEKLVLRYTDLGDGDLSVINNYRYLSYLDLAYTKRITNKVIENMKKLKHLRFIDLEGTSVNEWGVIELASIKSLRYVSLRFLSLSIEVFDYLKKLPLKGLYLDNLSFGDKEFSLLKEFTTLENLSLKGTQITDAGLKAFSKLKHLKQLNLEETTITDNGLVNLNKLTDIRLLNLSKTKVEGNGLKNLEKLNNLRYLNLSGCNIKDSALVEIAKLISLRKLILETTKITGKTLGKLSVFKYLNTLSLSDTKVDDMSILVIKLFPKLTFLYLDTTMVSCTGVKTLYSFLPGLKIFGVCKDLDPSTVPAKKK